MFLNILLGCLASMFIAGILIFLGAMIEHVFNENYERTNALLRIAMVLMIFPFFVVVIIFFVVVIIGLFFLWGAILHI